MMVRKARIAAGYRLNDPSAQRPDRFWGSDHSILSSRYKGLFSLGVKWQGNEADQPLASIKIKKTWVYEGVALK
jgi:hypothetical protein